MVVGGLVGEPVDLLGPRSLPACGSIATTSTSGAAALASTIVERPRKLPISTIDPPSGHRVAGVEQRRRLARGHPPVDVGDGVITVGRSSRLSVPVQEA